MSGPYWEDGAKRDEVIAKITEITDHVETAERIYDDVVGPEILRAVTELHAAVLMGLRKAWRGTQ